MLYYLLLPFLSILLIILQSTITDIIFSGRLVFDLSLIVIVYAGFHLDLIRGSILAFILGFVFDCVSGPVTGLFAFIYVVVFLCSFSVSGRLATEKIYIIVLFSLFCALLEDLIVILFYSLVFKFNVATNIYFVFLPQALIISIFAPVFFYLMRRAEVFFYGKTE
ncbi:MAG: rod shape-determining protein MreD [Deltaproteobacteria bacterium]|nr:rod shape-determining protein MreD [Deltaproteobacteria bacterium]